MLRNRGARGYRPKQAHALYQARLLACENGARIAAETWTVVALGHWKDLFTIAKELVLAIGRGKASKLS